MSAMMGPGPDPAAMGMMQEMLAGEGKVPFSAQANAVVCQACRLPIDPETGAPLEPATRENVDAVRQYMTEAGAAELGGVQLEPQLGGMA